MQTALTAKSAKSWQCRFVQLPWIGDAGGLSLFEHSTLSLPTILAKKQPVIHQIHTFLAILHTCTVNEQTRNASCLTRNVAFLTCFVTFLVSIVAFLVWNAPCLTWNAAFLVCFVPFLTCNVAFLVWNAANLTWNAPCLTWNVASLTWNVTFLVRNVVSLTWNAPCLTWNAPSLTWNVAFLVWNWAFPSLKNDPPGALCLKMRQSAPFELVRHRHPASLTADYGMVFALGTGESAAGSRKASTDSTRKPRMRMLHLTPQTCARAWMTASVKWLRFPSRPGSSMELRFGPQKIFLFFCAKLSEQIRDVFSFFDFTTSAPDFCKRQRCHAFIIFCINVSAIFQQPFNGLKCSLLSREM